MFSNLQADDSANLGRVAGIVLFVVAFALPGVRLGSRIYPGFECAWHTLFGTLSFVASLGGRARESTPLFFFMISGWISPLVIFGILVENMKFKQRLARVLPVLLLAPWAVFAWPQSGWGATQFHPCIGHYFWTAGCLLIFVPEYLSMFVDKNKPVSPDSE